MPNLKFEKYLWKQGYKNIAGIDEVGRGSLAGPVLSTAVILNKLDYNYLLSININDSKKIAKSKHCNLFYDIVKYCQVGIGIASVHEIEQFNILNATILSMQRAVSGLGWDYILIDGNQLPSIWPKYYSIECYNSYDLINHLILYNHNDKLCSSFTLSNNGSNGINFKCDSIIKGDQKSLSIAAASICGKYLRDQLMIQLDSITDNLYHWDKNAGYGTSYHISAIKQHGTSIYHRKKFCH